VFIIAFITQDNKKVRLFYFACLPRKPRIYLQLSLRLTSPPCYVFVQRRHHQPSQIDGSLRRRKSSLNSIQVVVHEALALLSAASSSPAQHSGIHPLLLAARFLVYSFFL